MSRADRGHSLGDLQGGLEEVEMASKIAAANGMKRATSLMAMGH
jgi:hypothetical protein